MPLPTPHDGEKESEFVSRCMGSEAAKEFEDEKQRLAVCYSQFRERKSKQTRGSRHLDIQADVIFEIGG